MKAYLSARGIEFEDRDVSTDAQAVEELIYKYQSRSTPTLVIDGQVLIGFDPDELDGLIG